MYSGLLIILAPLIAGYLIYGQQHGTEKSSAVV